MFQNLEVYGEAKVLHRDVYNLTSKFPKSIEYLTLQLRRAALSIVLNIAEGSAKSSKKDFNRFIQVSLGSTYEVMAGLEIAEDITGKKLEKLVNSCTNLRNGLGALSKHLSSH